MRICQPYGDDQRQSLAYFHEIEPDYLEQSGGPCPWSQFWDHLQQNRRSG